MKNVVRELSTGPARDLGATAARTIFRIYGASREIWK